MKKIWFLAFFLFIFLLSSNFAFAKSDLADSQSNATEQDSSIKYELPYPGLLPDNPLYVLRVIRDRIVSFLIADPKKKAEFYLLQADKRLNAGVFLVDKKKIEPGISTISKAENYFHEAIQRAKDARMQGMDITEIINKLKDSSVKHQEVINTLKEKSPEKFKESFVQLAKRASDFETEVKTLMLEK